MGRLESPPQSTATSIRLQTNFARRINGHKLNFRELSFTRSPYEKSCFFIAFIDRGGGVLGCLRMRWKREQNHDARRTGCLNAFRHDRHVIQILLLATPRSWPCGRLLFFCSVLAFMRRYVPKTNCLNDNMAMAPKISSRCDCFDIRNWRISSTSLVNQGD